MLPDDCPGETEYSISDWTITQIYAERNLGWIVSLFLFAGVLMWEVFTCGEMPYGKMPNHQVVEYVVTQNKRLDNPAHCPPQLFSIMYKTWASVSDSQSVVSSFRPDNDRCLLWAWPWLVQLMMICTWSCIVFDLISVWPCTVLRCTVSRFCIELSLVIPIILMNRLPQNHLNYSPFLFFRNQKTDQTLRHCDSN